MLNRRIFLGSALMLPLAGSISPAADAAAKLSALEKKSGGRLGVAAWNCGGTKHLLWRAEERFTFCSTFKFLLVTCVLDRIARGQEQHERKIAYSAGDMVVYSPITQKHLADGEMRIDGLCAAALEVSDNTAANLLLSTVGGPAGLTAYARRIGDNSFRLDRIEPALNQAEPGDVRDTTTPAAMARDVEAILNGTVLAQEERRQLSDWMATSTTGAKRLRAGLPQGWRIIDKTGSGGHGTYNDIGLIERPAGSPVAAAVYYTEAPGSAAKAEAVLASAGAIIAAAF